MPGMVRGKVAIFGSVLFLLITQPLHAEIYRWTDDQGKVHFSDKPVSDKAKQVKIKVAPATPQNKQNIQERKLKAERFLRAREEEREEKNKEIAKKKELKKKRERKCKAAQREYGRMSRARTIYYKGKDGARDYIGDNERTKLLKAAKAEIKKWCN